MLDLFARFRAKAPEAKISRAAPLVSLSQLGRPQWSPREARVLAETVETAT